MIKPETAPVAVADDVVATTGADAAVVVDRHEVQWQASYDLERRRAETERLKVLVEFLSRPIHAHGGTEPDPDIVCEYNLAVEAALRGIRRAALGG